MWYLIVPSPDICTLSYFKVMNQVKNEYRAKLTQEILNAVVAIALPERGASDMCLQDASSENISKIVCQYIKLNLLSSSLVKANQPLTLKPSSVNSCSL